MGYKNNEALLMVLRRAGLYAETIKLDANIARTERLLSDIFLNCIQYF